MIERAPEDDTGQPSFGWSDYVTTAGAVLFVVGSVLSTLFITPPPIEWYGPVGLAGAPEVGKRIGELGMALGVIGLLLVVVGGWMPDEY